MIKVGVPKPRVRYGPTKAALLKAGLKGLAMGALLAAVGVKLWAAM